MELCFIIFMITKLIKTQGSIDKDDFYKMIKFIGRNNILNCDVFFDKLKNKNLKK